MSVRPTEAPSRINATLLTSKMTLDSRVHVFEFLVPLDAPLRQAQHHSPVFGNLLHAEVVACWGTRHDAHLHLCSRSIARYSDDYDFRDESMRSFVTRRSQTIILPINNANETQCSAFCITYKIPNAQEMPINQFAKDKHSAVPRDGSRRDRLQTRWTIRARSATLYTPA